MSEEKDKSKPYRILSLDGGGAKGFYSLGVLAEIEGLIGCRLHERFDLVFGTSTGAIIAAMIALGMSVDEIHANYKKYVPDIMRLKTPAQKSAKVAELAKALFGDKKFDEVKTAVGVVATKWVIERPMIFKGSIAQAHGRKGTFQPGFGVTIADAVQASCSAFPFFEPKTVTTGGGDEIKLVDGGYCANNPTLYAIADATHALKLEHKDLRVVSVGVGVYPQPRVSIFNKMYWAKYLLSVQLLQKTLEINTQSMDQLRVILFKDVPTVRISDTFEQPEMAADLFEHNLLKLNILRQRGRESFAKHEATLKEFLV
ncbi:patatin-like phospholipase family protein [Mesorhizobium sp. BR1-1-14]|uniref:patatin-like phospholipase family protein n=1 Tax=Mesorhizobium sp. BR1-1-14 TaxID=2876655 RepID=UPI001CD15587|nr:patatin-like phospholipase family protein [Mesorhizobium sp. BR1-1-14]MBZ9959332.1 patatin-like phospholipase family protein [Mesorhizobium sp. BR1-1-14]